MLWLSSTIASVSRRVAGACALYLAACGSGQPPLVGRVDAHRGGVVGRTCGGCSVAKEDHFGAVLTEARGLPLSGKDVDPERRRFLTLVEELLDDGRCSLILHLDASLDEERQAELHALVAARATSNGLKDLA